MERFVQTEQLKINSAQVASDISIRGSLGQAQAEAEIANAKASVYANTLRARIDVLSAVYNSTLAYTQARSNAGIQLYSTRQDLMLREAMFARQYYNDFMRSKVQWRADLSNGIVGSYDMGWKAILQNLMVLKEALSAVGATNSGVEHVPSTFENIQNVSSLATGLISTAINVGMVLA